METVNQIILAKSVNIFRRKSSSEQTKQSTDSEIIKKSLRCCFDCTCGAASWSGVRKWCFNSSSSQNYNVYCWLCLLLLLVAKWIDLGVVLYLRWQIFALVDLPLLDIVKGIPLLLYEKIGMLAVDIFCTAYPPRLVNVFKERSTSRQRSSETRWW